MDSDGMREFWFYFCIRVMHYVLSLIILIRANYIYLPWRLSIFHLPPFSFWIDIRLPWLLTDVNSVNTSNKMSILPFLIKILFLFPQSPKIPNYANALFSSLPHSSPPLPSTRSSQPEETMSCSSSATKGSMDTHVGGSSTPKSHLEVASVSFWCS